MTRLEHLWLACATALAPLASAAAGLGYDEALALAQQQAPALRAGAAAIDGATAARVAAATLPDPRLAVGIESLPLAGPDRYSTTRDTATMQRLALMQEVPSRAKREARQRVADARIERERATLAVTELAVRRDTALAWLAVHFGERKRALLAEQQRENQRLQDTLAARITAGEAMPADLTMARQDALMLADRGDELQRELLRSRAELRRWVGERGAEPLAGEPSLPPVDPEAARAGLHRHAELTAYEPMQAQANAEIAEAASESRGDWSWEVAYNRRPRYDDMVSFQISFDLPWQRERRQQPTIDARRRELDRLEAERDDLRRRHAVEVETMLAELQAVDTQWARLQGPGLALAREREALALAAYGSRRGELGAVFTARTQALDTRLRAIDLEAQRSALIVRLSTLRAE